MALKTLRFAFKADRGRERAIQQFREIERAICDSVLGKDYGSGVKEIFIGIVLMDAEHSQKFAARKPVYKPGKYELREAGFSMWLEDTLEFDIVPRSEEMHRPNSLEESVQALLDGLRRSYLLLQKAKIPDFDVTCFLSDLNEALLRIASSRSSSDLPTLDHDNEVDLNIEQSDSPSDSISQQQVFIRVFARDVMAFVERELPTVQLAVREKRRDLLGPVVTRSQKFLDRWRLTAPSVLDACPACACLIADVAREAAVEIDHTSGEERRRVHEEFQRELQICKAIASL